ncbi:MAG: Rac GTPase-activating protein 1, partial [Paramarteilia canceri]
NEKIKIIREQLISGSSTSSIFDNKENDVQKNGADYAKPLIYKQENDASSFSISSSEDFPHLKKYNNEQLNKDRPKPQYSTKNHSDRMPINIVSSCIEKHSKNNKIVCSSELTSTKTLMSPQPSKKTIKMSTPNINQKLSSKHQDYFDDYMVTEQHKTLSPNAINKESIQVNINNNHEKTTFNIKNLFPSNHHFKSQVSSISQVCSNCERKLGFRKSIKQCVSCRALCHTECFNSLPNPCFPSNNSDTPQKNRTMQTSKHSIPDYCQKINPCVPGLIAHILIEIEARGLNFVGLYTMNGPQKRVKEIIDRYFNYGHIPNFSIISDIGILTDCVKEFFIRLDDSLIPGSHWKSFCRATIRTDQSELSKCVRHLPQPYRDLLSLIVRHLQSVCCHSKMNKTSPKILARIFGDIFAKYKHEESSDYVQYFNQKENQISVFFVSFLE